MKWPPEAAGLRAARADSFSGKGESLIKPEA